MSEPNDARRKGRPPKQVSPPEHPGLQVEAPLASLPPTARHVLDVAWRVLLERGYRGLTIEAVALEAGEAPATIKRHFGTKAGLVEALLDAVTQDAYVTLTERVHRLPPGDERIHAYITGLHEIIVDTPASQAILEIAPLAVRDEFVRRRIAALYAWYRQLTLEESGMLDQLAGRSVDARLRQELEQVAAVILAALDGLAYQAVLDPEGFDGEGTMATLAEMVRARVRGLLDA
jgi:AcrR family transcriptional regulator